MAASKTASSSPPPALLVPALIARVEELTALVEKVEWSGGLGTPDCPLCGVEKPGPHLYDCEFAQAGFNAPANMHCPLCKQAKGHAPDCRLAAALKEKP